MKRASFKRITALILAIVMLLPMISIPTFAADATSDSTIFYEDFCSYEGLEGEALKAKVKKSWFQTANNMEVITENDDTYLRFPIQALIAGSQYDVPYYAYNDSYRHFLNDNKSYSGIKSYDHETGTLVFAHATDSSLDLTVAVDTSKANAAGDMFGTFTYGGTTYKLATGEYAACSRFGDGNCIDRYAHIYFGDRTLYTAEDVEVQAGTKNVGDVKAEPAGISYKDYDKVVISYKAMIEPDSAGTLNMQLNRFGNASSNGSYNQNFVELGNLNLATGAWSGGALNGATLPIGEWVELYFIVDLKAATIQGIYNGKVYGSAACGTKGEGGLILSGWTVSKVMKSEPAKLSGAWLIDDVKVSTETSGLVKFNNYYNDFESANVGGTVPGISGINSAYKIADLGDEHGKVWALGNSNEGTGARDSNAKIAHEFFSAEMNRYLTLSYDYYIPTGTGNQFQTQIYQITGVDANGATVTKNWNDLSVVRSKGGVATVGTEANPAQFNVNYDEWFTVAIEIDMATASWDIYVNGSLAVAGIKHASLKSFSSINAAQIIVGKQNKSADSYLAGTMYMDNISLEGGAYDAAFSTEDVWTDVDDLYADQLVFDLDNAEVAGSGAFIQGHAYSFPSTLIFADADEDFTPDGIQLNIASDIVDGAEKAIDKMVRPMHVGISAKKASTVVLSADYTVSEDAQGKIQAELFDNNNWKNLFILDADASTIEGVAFNKGETFNITVVLDMVNGDADVYYNQLLINVLSNEAIIKNGLNAAEWSVAKIMKDCADYAGNVVVENMTVTAVEPDFVLDHEHEFGEYMTKLTLVAPATCTTPAQYAYSCTCGLLAEETFGYGEALGHDWDEGAVAEDGSTIYTCYTCGESYAEEPAHVHEFIIANPSADTLASLATCTEPAYYFYTCACGEISEAVYASGKANGHKFGDWLYSDEYEHVRTCIYCDSPQFMPHSPNMSDSKAPTCGEPGYYVYTCVCGFSYDESIPETGEHEYHLVDCMKPTCSSDGYEEYQCVCGDSYVNKLPATNEHNYAVVGSKDATCSEAGYVDYMCECGKSYTETFPATGKHVWGKTEDNGDGVITHYCRYCDETYEEYYEVSLGTLKIFADKQTVMVGDIITVVFEISENPGVAGLIVTPNYDANALKLISTDAGYVFEDCTMGKNLVFSNTGDTYTTGKLVTFTFEVLVEGDTTVTLIARECANNDLRDVVVEVTAAEISAISFIYGDANNDGVVNLRDSIILRNYLAAYDYDTGASDVEVGFGADANGDGRINLMDSILLMNYLAAYDYDTGTSDVVLGPKA